MGKVDKSLDPCPVCGKYPKVYKDLGYRTDEKDNLIRYTSICTIRCKRPFKHAHLSVTTSAVGYDYKEAYKNAVDWWNFEVSKLKGELNG